MHFRKIQFILFFALLAIACSSPTTSSTKPGTISGTIYDATDGSVLEKASVVTNPPTFSVTTDSLGSYSITNVPPGTYHVTANMFGYDSAGVDIAVDSKLTTTADISLLPDTTQTR